MTMSRSQKATQSIDDCLTENDIKKLLFSITSETVLKLFCDI